MSLNIKLVYNNEIHRLSQLPRSYQELLCYCSQLFPSASFRLSYQDEEGDTITIACDSDLFTAYATCEAFNLHSLKLKLTDQNASAFSSRTQSATFPAQTVPENTPDLVWPRHTCDGCNTKPIVGPRFHCTVCEDFDFCKTCEQHRQHEHPFIKFASPTEDQYLNIDINPESLCAGLQRLRDFISSQKPQMQVREHVNFENATAGEISLRWQVRNSGRQPWPAGSVVVLEKGNFSAVFDTVPELLPGEEAEIRAKAWSKGGELFGKWRVQTKEGMKIGKVKARVRVREDFEEKVRILAEMGFSREIAKEALVRAGGDLEKAVANLAYY
jgi:hypothetical protein